MAENVYTPSQILARWALRICGGRLTNPTTVATGGEMDPVDEDSRIVDYVRTTEGYADAEAVLKWKHCYAHTLESWTIKQPGETFEYALGVRRWRKYLGVTERQLGPVLYEQFFANLSDRCRREPLKVHESVAVDAPMMSKGEARQFEKILSQRA